MKRSIALLVTGICICTSSFTQTLQDVTANGNNKTSNGIAVINGAEAAVCSGNFTTGDAAVVLKAAGTNTNGGYAEIQSFYHNWGYVAPLVLNKYGGNVGIGVANPVCKLEVNGNVLLGGGNLDPVIPDYLPVLSGTGKLLVGWNRHAGDGEVDLIANRGAGNQGGFRFWDYTNNNVLNDLMVLDGNANLTLYGNQTIGTTATQRNLNVNGSVKTRKIKVTQTDWPDYVFDSSYNLPSLSHVETFIQQNKHLPEVPSAAEVKKEGLDLGDNQAVLLKKIEELTLYIIQQNKQLNQQNAQIMQQTKKVEELEKRLQELEIN